MVESLALQANGSRFKSSGAVAAANNPQLPEPQTQRKISLKFSQFITGMNFAPARSQVVQGRQPYPVAALGGCLEC